MLENIERLVVAAWPYPSASTPGAAIFVRDQAQVLAERCAVAVALCGPRGWRGRGGRSHLAADVETVVVGRPARPRLPRSRSSAAAATVRTMAASMGSLSQSWQRPTLIHAHGVYPAGWAAVHYGARMHVPVVVTEHTSMWGLQIRRPDDAARARLVLDAADAVVAVGPKLAHDLESFARRDVHVVANVLRTADMPPIPQDGDGSNVNGPLVVIGGLVEQKGIDLLIEAMARSTKTRGRDLIVVGEGPLRDGLQDLARSRGISARFVGWRPRQEVFELTRHAALAVVPSRHESFSLAAAEALALGVPVVAAECGGPEEFVGSDGRIVPKEDVEALSGAIDDVLDTLDTFDAASIARRARDRFGEQRFLDSIDAVYGIALGRPRSSSFGPRTS